MERHSPASMIDDAMYLLRRACSSPHVQDFCVDFEDALVVLMDGARSDEWVEVGVARAALLVARKARELAASCRDCSVEGELLLETSRLLEKAAVMILEGEYFAQEEY